MRLAVCVEKVDVDLAVSTGRTDLPHSSVAPIDGGFLRVNGKNQTENRHVKIGSYHTLEIIPERPLYLTKIHWDALAVQILRQAAGSIGRVEVGAIAMDPIKGVACVCLITPTGIDNPLSRINIPMPKKRIGSTSQTEKVDAKFLDACLDASLKYIRFDQLKAIVIGSSVAQSRDLFCEKLLSRISSSSSVHIKTQKTSDIARKFVRVTITDGTPAALQTVLSDSRVSSILSDTKVAREQAALDDYHKTCNMDQFRVTFGPRHVEAAASEGAVRHLLLTDACFRSSDVKERKFYSKIVCDTEENGGQVIIFSQDSKPSKDLAAISGIAAILNWPIKPDDEK